MSAYTQARSLLAALKARIQMLGGRFNVLSLLFTWLAKVKNTVEDVLSKFPQSGPALAGLVALVLVHFGFHGISAGKVEAVWAAVAVLIAALTAHSVRKASAKASADK